MSILRFHPGCNLIAVQSKVNLLSPIFTLILGKNIFSQVQKKNSGVNSPFTYCFHNCYRPQTKLQKGNVFTSVCQEFCPRGGGCTHTPWADTHPAGQTPHPPPWPDTTPQQTATGADGTLPTGMHSCSVLILFLKFHRHKE